MSQNTQNYKRSLSGSVGAGLKSVFNTSGRTYYILEHKVSSKYHKAGESQEIIVDQIEIGRDAKCAVQFDESFQTISRRHAAIVRDGENWKLIHLSETNKTFLNGHSVEKEWYLQTGDEIQLSVNGPKLGFIIPKGDKAKTGSIGLSRRLSLFRQQALRPYKTALYIMAAFIVVLLCAGIWYAYKVNTKMSVMSDQLRDSQRKIELLQKVNESLRKEMARQDSIYKDQIEIIERLKKQPVPKDIASLIANAETDVYLIQTEVFIDIDGEITDLDFTTIGTAFLLDNGYFVTARHCIEPWLYLSGFETLNAATEECDGIKLISRITAYDAKGLKFEFVNDCFKTDREHDIEGLYEMDDGTEVRIRIPRDSEGKNNDWAYATQDSKKRLLPKGKLRNDAAKSTSMKKGEDVHLLGFPGGMGIYDRNDGTVADPVYIGMKIAMDGLNNRDMITISYGADHGNSGGPLFVRKGNELYVIGILSGGAIKSDRYDEVVPISKVVR